ncbi:hypothetical protein EDB87DRAFT_1775863 [Lactarius vividus]|nr:hypothetical protein EDB87DRAFT_1775863 [Lactarius vividus]
MEDELSSINSAKQLQSTFDSAYLRIRDVQARFNSRSLETSEDVSGSHESGSFPKTPDALAAEVADYMSFMRRLKFQYLENNAKDKYVKTIVNDEAPMITADTNVDLQAANSVKKDKLKSAKTRLAERHSDIRNLAPLVEHGGVQFRSEWHNLTEGVDYLKAKGLSGEAVALTQSILDARLAIMRLRGIHPSPPLTIPVAEETLSSQVADMQMLEDELQAINEKIARVKDTIKEDTVKVDRLWSEKAELEKRVPAHNVEADDGRAAKLCDWYSSSLALHRSLFNVQLPQSISENELMLSYEIKPKAKQSRIVVIVLLFLPNTRQLADVRIEGLEGVDMTNIVDSFVQANDVPGLIWHVLSRARQIK